MADNITTLHKNEEIDLAKGAPYIPLTQHFLPSQIERRRKYNFPKFPVDSKKSEKDEDVENEVQKDLAKEEAKQKEMFINAVDDSSMPLLRIKSVFPFDFFPNELIVDMVKVTMVKKDFFFSGSSEAVYIKDIANVIVETGPFLSTLKIIDISYNTEKHNIQYLKRKDAFRARILIEGLVTAAKRGIDLCKLNRKEVVPYINQLSGISKIAAP
jgi:hypothetical protein